METLKSENMSSKNILNSSINNNNNINLKLRRVNSGTRLSEIKDYEKKVRRERVDQPYDYISVTIFEFQSKLVNFQSS